MTPTGGSLNLSDSNVGGQKGRNVRDNIFVINAILNSITKQNADAHDLQIYDVDKCFDSMWLHECVNALFEAGLNNDKLPLLFMSNSTAQVAIKTATGITDRISILKIVMQGTVWGSLFCVALMDKLVKLVNKDENLLFYYKNSVPIQPLEMVDDILTVTNVENTLIMNERVNTFIEHKNLRL